MKGKLILTACMLLGIYAKGSCYEPGRCCGADSRISNDEVVNVYDNNCCLHVPQGINLPAPAYKNGCRDFFVSASFIYWMVGSDSWNYNICPYNFLVIPPFVTGSTQISSSPVGVVTSGICHTEIHEPQYRPGFKVGFGTTFGCDNWKASFEYTRLNQKTKTSWNANEGLSPFDVGARTIIFAQAPYNITSDLADTTWTLNYNVADAVVSREYYVGKSLVFEPFAGIRGAWINENFRIAARSTPGTPWALNPLVFSSGVADFASKQWGLGARVGLHGEWLLPCGFRFDSKASGSLLYTRYTKLTQSNVGSTSLIINDISRCGFRDPYNAVRPNAELCLGLGWGSCFGCNNQYGFDVLLSYDFNVWLQNSMLRGVSESMIIGNGSHPSTLMLHGLTVKTQFVF